MIDIFRLFKKITNEEVKIIDIINKNIKINSSTKILDIGSNSGLISKNLQSNKNNITLIDIDEFNTEPEIKFIKSSWENAIIENRFDLIIVSHVWGHFGYKGTQQESFSKMIKHKEKNGKIVLCYNTNSYFMSKLVDFSKKLFRDFQYDYFDEDIIRNYNKKEIIFKVKLKTRNFSSLAELVKILIILDDDKYYKRRVEEFLSSNLTKPEFEIEQKVIIIQ